jgi:radical SAM superfamily enzyme YgiQ (UPF0313 family)
LFNEQIAELLKNMGFVSIRFGLETASDRLLRRINKKATVEDHQNAINIANKHGIPICGSVMRGLPGETEKDRELTRKFIAKNKDKFSVSGDYEFRPFPGSKFYKGENPLEIDMRVR